MRTFKIFLFLTAAVFYSGQTFSQPTISSLNQKSGPTGTLVTITGSNFSTVADQNIVYFGAAKAFVTNASSTTLTVKAPAGATHDAISVTSNNLAAYTDPFITSFPGGGTIDSATFEIKKDFPVLNGQFSLVLNDFDGDGKTDIACGNAGPESSYGNFSIYPNSGKTGAISFATRIDVRGVGTCYDMAVGDLNGDGKADLVFADYIFGALVFSKNTSTPGSVSFAAAVNYRATLTNPKGINVADIDGDGRLDVLTVNPVSSTVSILRNTGENGNISFAPKVNVTTGGGARINIADMDGDGKVDLVYTINNSVTIFKNSSTVGNISFDSQVSLPISSGALAIGDADGDGKPDLAITSGSVITVYRNNGTPGTVSLGNPVNVNIGPTFYQIVFSDIDGDGRPDIIGFNNGTNTAYVLKNKSVPGTISFAEKTGYGTGDRLFYVASGDLDGDAKPEIVTFNMSNSISILRNKTTEPATISSGANPVVGNVTNEVTVDESVQAYNGKPYVQRHYDIEPENNPGTSTATITLYFTQEEFTSFNAHPSHAPVLPSDPNDNAGKANLRVYQYHGTSTTSTPGSYDGGTIEINPDDNKISWNTLLSRWEVTFDVTGFSGFFVSSSSTVVLPLTLLSFDVLVTNDIAVLHWATTNEINVGYFNLERSEDGRNYTQVSKIEAKGTGNTSTQYSYSDKPGNEDVYYYRLKIVDRDGTIKYSNILKINSTSKKSAFSLFPNPAHGSVMVETPVVGHESELRLMDMNGRLIKVFPIGKSSPRTKINLATIMTGSYKMIWTDGVKSMVQTILIK